MLQDAGWASYLAARRAALASCADADPASIGRAEQRLAAYLGLAPQDARRQARRNHLLAADAAFHDQLLGSGRIDILRTLIDQGARVPALPRTAGGSVAISLHYGPATSILPLCLARASRTGQIAAFAVIQNSHRDPAVMLSPQRQAELSAHGFPLIDLDIARLGEVGALRRALAILRAGGTALIFVDGQLPPADAKRTIACRLGRGALALADGAAWLARSANVPLLPLLVRPRHDIHGVEAMPAARAEDAARAYQALIDLAMPSDPAPWSRWAASAEHF
ncbi:MAG TPA: hypothetical protein VII40_18210 [Xanthobacteraceae bacterium]|jgi:hypothetical protein